MIGQTKGRRVHFAGFLAQQAIENAFKAIVIGRDASC